MCCRGLAKFYLTFLSTLTAIVGIAVIGASTYGLVKFGDIDAILSQRALIGVLCAGVVVFLFSLLGCCAAKSHNKCGLLIYVAGLLVVVVLQLVAGAVIADYAGDLTTTNGNIEGLSNDVQQFVECSYGWCCSNSTALAKCNTEVWNSNGFCSILPDELSDPSSSECASEPAFNQVLVDWLHDNQRAFAIAALVLGGVQLLAVLFGIYLLCSSKEKTPAQIEEERRLADANNYHNGGALSYGSAQPVSGGAVHYAV